MLNNRIEKLELERIESRSQIEKIKYQSNIYYAINEIMQISLSDMPLEKKLKRILKQIFDMNWLKVMPQGSILVTIDDKEPIVIKSEGLENQGISDETSVNHRESSSRSKWRDDSIETLAGIRIKQNIQSKRFYVPILGAHKNYGSINLNVIQGHQPSMFENEFLEVVAQIIANILEKKELENKLLEQSYRDDLTGLANRRLLYQNLTRSLAKSKRDDSSWSILFIDLNKFKIINDSYGHEVGDQVLIKVSNRMQGCLRSCDLLARVGGDEFVILLEATATKEDLNEVICRLILTVEKPMTINEMQIRISFSLGVSSFPKDGKTIDELLLCSDKNMYLDKNKAH